MKWDKVEKHTRSCLPGNLFRSSVSHGLKRSGRIARLFTFRITNWCVGYAAIRRYKFWCMIYFPRRRLHNTRKSSDKINTWLALFSSRQWNWEPTPISNWPLICYIRSRLRKTQQVIENGVMDMCGRWWPSPKEEEKCEKANPRSKERGISV